MTTEQLPPCKECGLMPVESLEWTNMCEHPSPSKCKFARVLDVVSRHLWRLIHTPDPRIAELTAQVYELDRLLAESQCYAAELDMELRALRAKQPIWDTIAQAADAIPDSALADVPTDGASNHDKYLYGQGESKAIFDHVAETKPEEL